MNGESGIELRMELGEDEVQRTWKDYFGGSLYYGETVGGCSPHV